MLYLLENCRSVDQLSRKTFASEVLLQKSEVILVTDIPIIVNIHCPEEHLKMCRCWLELKKRKCIIDSLREFLLTHHALRPLRVYLLAMQSLNSNLS